jgi:hypothetical protein
MGLFSTLLSDPSQVQTSESGDVATTASSSLSLPTVIHMYTDTPYQLENTTLIPSYAYLTFQAVHVPAGLVDDATTPEQTGRKPKALDYVPDLGVWNCCVTPSVLISSTEAQSISLADSILSSPLSDCSTTTTPTFCWKVDLANSHSVEPTLTCLQDALIRHLIRSTTPLGVSKTAGDTATATTSLYELRSVQFGLAPHDETKTTASPSEEDRHTKKGAAENDDDVDSYRQQQTLSLLFYHLRRYAAALNASLVFVRSMSTFSPGAVDTDVATTDLQPTLTLPQLSAVWLALAQQKQVWNENVLTDVLEGLVLHCETGHAVLYGPGTHAPDWIESALLRNAQYPGHWDAAKESVWNILPPRVATAVTRTTASTQHGDDFWLKELRESVAMPAAAVATPIRPTAVAESAKTPDVSDYFANLLNT